MQLWDLVTGTRIPAFPDAPGSHIAISPDGRYALSCEEGESLRLWEFSWDYEFPEPAEWDEGARPYLETFLTLHRPLGEDGINRVGRATWGEGDFHKLILELQHRGYGWLRSDGVRRELERMTDHWAAP